MKDLSVVLIVLCCFMMMNACNKVENSAGQDVGAENSEAGILEEELVKEKLKEKFLGKLGLYTDEKVASVVIDCFASGEQYSAFIITVPTKKQLPQNGDNIEAYFITSSLWYVDETSCVNVYQNDDNGSILLSSGILKNGMCCVSVGRMTAYAPEVNYDTCYYTVENGQPIYLFTTASSVINDEGYIETKEIFWEEGRKTKYCIYDYQDGELTFIKEMYEELKTNE